MTYSSVFAVVIFSFSFVYYLMMMVYQRNIYL